MSTPSTHNISNIAAHEIAELDDCDLIQLIRSVKIPQIEQMGESRLQFSSRATLERLAHLGRRCCQNRTSMAN